VKRIISILAVLSVFFVNTNAQNIVLRGKVIDGDTKEPIPGVTVVEFDENKRVINGAISDPNGNYILQAKKLNSTVQFSFIGYKSQTFELNGRTNLDVDLSPETMNIEEVMITARSSADDITGLAERNRASAATEVTIDDLKGAAITDASDALQGQVAGLDIISSGSPGGGSSIVIRGLGTLGNARPLIVVDGIAQNININSDFDFGTADTEDIGDLVSISPQDIRSIIVLKDAASAAKWGSRAADGVLEIRTQQGKKGKTQFEYQYKFSLTKEPKLMPMLNGDEYVILQLEEHQNRYGIFNVPDQIAYDLNYEDFNNWNKNTDWMGAITRNGSKGEHFFKVSGGGEKTLYYASVTMNNDIGTTLNESAKKLSTRINLDYNVSTKIRFQIRFNYNNIFREGNPRLVRGMAYIKPPNMSIWEYDENNDLTGDYYSPINAYQGSGKVFYNPVAMVDLGKQDTDRNQIENSYVFKYSIAKWLDFTETVSFQYANSQTEQYLPAEAYGTDWLVKTNDQSIERNTTDLIITSRSQLLFRPILTSTHNLSASFIWETRQTKNSWMMISGALTPTDQIYDPSSNPVLSYNDAYEQEVRDLGLLASVNYILKDRYIINSIIRADASSKFGENNRWGYFPSIALAWRFSSEPWFEGMRSVLNDGKLRASYGQVGKQPNQAYIRHGFYNETNPPQYSEHPVIIPTSIQLENLKWQTVEQFNYGIDLSFFKSKLNLNFDYYDKTTKDLLWQGSSAYQIPSTSGYTQLSAFNGGELKNRGWEFSANGTVLSKDDFIWLLNMNISKNTNAYSEFPENFNNERNTDVGNEKYPTLAAIGQPIGSFYGFLSLGVYPTDADAVARDANGNIRLDASGDPIPMMYKEQFQFQGGDARYADINFDGVIDLNDVVNLGDSNPEFYGGFGTSARYKFIRFNVNFNYRVGYEIVNELAMSTQGMNGYNNQSTAVLHRWRRQGHDEEGMLPRAYLSHPANNLGSDRYVEPGDYLRLNNLSITFRVPNAFSKRMGFETLEAGINLRKIYTLTRYTGQDVEINMNASNPFWFGTDRGYSPTPKVYSFNIRGRF
jgi:TonB-linked SusC/RagA family outer membrane protein